MFSFFMNVALAKFTTANKLQTIASCSNVLETNNFIYGKQARKATLVQHILKHRTKSNLPYPNTGAGLHGQHSDQSLLKLTTSFDVA